MSIYRLSTVTEKSAYSYIISTNASFVANNTQTLYPTDFTDWSTAFEPIPGQGEFIKNCGQIKKNGREANKRGGKVGLAPNNALTQNLGAQFIKAGQVPWYFDSDALIEAEMVKDISEYGTLDTVNNVANQFCFAITFDEYGSGKYKYNLRFNETGPNRIDDHYDPFEIQAVPYQTEKEDWWIQLRDSGLAIIMNMVDNFILQEQLGITNAATPNAYIKTTLTQQPIEGDKSNDLMFMTNYGGVVVWLVVIPLIVMYLNFIKRLVAEKELRIAENMRNMGMSIWKNQTSWLLFKLLELFIQSILWGIITKGGFFKNQNFINVWLLYFQLGTWMIAFGFFVSSQFTRSSPAVFVGTMLWLLFFFSAVSLPTENTAENTLNVYAISPFAGAVLASRVLLNYESNYLRYEMSMWFEPVSNFKYGTYFFMTIFQIVLFTFLGYYLEMVLPSEGGQKKHPCCCFGCKKKTNDTENKNKVNSKDQYDAQPQDGDLEEVDEALLAQRNNNQSIYIEKLRKVYKNKKVAVHCLDLEMFNNQIFGLLGHNGAGKTTTISMISGLLAKTTGKINIMGMDNSEKEDEIKKVMGICPQTNPLYPELTVSEHLWLYAKIKGMTDNDKIKVESEKILHDIDLFNKNLFQSQNLSGGQKRKLCVAQAVVGGSKILLLDEPSSGMDTYARRHLWEMLKNYKDGRIILLTTHYMDEADFLSDRIGIMKDGKLFTCGSTLFIKNRFGVGYDLTIVKNDNEVHSGPIENLVLQTIQTAKTVGNAGVELKIRLPMSDIDKFPTIFMNIEEKLAELGIKNYGIELTTLEQVFIDIIKMDRNVSDKPKSLTDINKDNKDPNNMAKETLGLKNQTFQDIIDISYSPETQRTIGNCAIFCMHFGALFRKRFIYFRRDQKGIMFEILVPIMLITIGLILTLQNFLRISPQMDLDASAAEAYTKPWLVFASSLVPSETTSIFARLNDNVNITVTTVAAMTSLTTFDTYLMSQFEKNKYNFFDYWVESFATNVGGSGLYQYDYTTWMNSSMPNSGPIAIALMNNEIFQTATGSTSNYIKHVMKPFPVSSEWKDLDDTIDGFICTFLFGLAIPFIPASILVYIVKERENNVKHQQVVSGVSIFAYWISNFVIDWVKYMIVAWWMLLMIQAFQINAFTKDDHYGAMIVITMLYGPVLIQFTYCTSFWWKNPSTAFFATYFINFLLGCIMVFVGFIFCAAKSTREIAFNFLNFLWRLIPQFCWSFGVFSTSNTTLWYTIYGTINKLTAFPTAFSEYGIKNESIYLTVYIFFFSGLLFVIEYKQSIFKCLYKTDEKKIQQMNDDLDKNIENQAIKDEDVKQEELDVKNGNEYTIKVEHLRKIYYTTPGGGCCGCNSENEKSGCCGSTPYDYSETKKKPTQVLAVKDLTFGVKTGECFGLLGTNGAGKTTTFKILSGEILPTEGQCQISGKNVVTSLHEVKHLIGYCPQFDSLLDRLTAREHLELYACIKGVPSEFREKLVMQLLQELRLTEYENVQAYSYSGGTKRKLSVGIALIGNPKFVFLDEPSSGMDPHAKRSMWNFLSKICSEKVGSSIILTTHSMEEAEALSNKLGIMVEGDLKCIGPVQALKTKYGNGYEIEIKIKIPPREYLTTTYGYSLEQQHLPIMGSEISEFFKKHQAEGFIHEISEKGKGSVIFKMFESKKPVSVLLVLEFIVIQFQGIAIMNFQKSSFGDIELLESFQSFFRFKTISEVKLSSLFGIMEEKVFFSTLLKKLEK